MSSSSQLHRPARSRAARLAAGAIGLSAVLVPVSLVAAPAAYAAPVDITLLNINDFHGRLDTNTTKVATTIEQQRLAGGEANTLLLSAGDNIGASLFASSNQQDTPTLDVLNALDLSASAVGNHEFDRGFADLSGRVDTEAAFPYLGANVYEKGTTTPALDEYTVVQAGGLDVGIIGAVTEETPSLVSPAGITTLDFGDPVEAVNRVAGQLSDGDPTNGEADVIVAEYHEGAGAGTPDGASFEEEVAAGGAFADIVTNTSAEVDAIFTGHTHKQYAWDAPVPGDPTRTRPVLQTGSYGENIGKVVLTVDDATGEVSDYTAENVARVATADTSLPRVAEVATITDAAITAANVVGDVPVGEVSADITTAFTGGTYGPDGYTGTTTRDDRASESALGNLVADALKDTPIDAPGLPTPDLGIVNPGGLRNELYFAPNQGGSSSPQDADGVVTFEEANAVLPFVNNIFYVTLTGAELKEVLEQQWQTDATGARPSRPFLNLGLSANVKVTRKADISPTSPVGGNILSVSIDGQPLDPAREYVVSTFSFLATGGDNFRAFTAGTSRDTGKIDRDLWIDGFLTGGGTKSPDFARRQVVATGLPTAAPAGEPVEIALQQLNLTSLGAPANTAVEARVDGTTLATFPVEADGSATVSMTVPGSAVGRRVELVAVPSGTTLSFPVSRALATMTAERKPQRVIVNRTNVRVKVAVSALGAPASGRVKVFVAGKAYSGTLKANGRITVRLPEFTSVGQKRLRVKYLGTDTVRSTTQILPLWVHRR